MIHSRESVLRCAAAMPKNLLAHKWSARKDHQDRYSITRKQGTLSVLRQLDACKSDEARRLILGRSK